MENKIDNRKTGNLGEDLACRYLKIKGFEIIERNYWKKYGEIDIVAKNIGKILERITFSLLD